MSKKYDYVSPHFLKILGTIIRSFKNETYNLLNLKEGAKVLDIGCGPGIDTIELVKNSNNAITVYGIDVDEEMIRLADEEARMAMVSDKVIHKVASAESIPFEDSFFDSCRADRLFQVLSKEADQAKIFSEIMRVLRPQGVVVLIDVDWATLSIDFSDVSVERKLISYFTEQIRTNGIAGRTFKKHLICSGFKDISVKTHIAQFDSFKQMPWLGKAFIDQAISDTIISPKQGSFWIDELAARSKGGTFFATNVTMIARAIK